jgi:hypothetical protein
MTSIHASEGRRGRAEWIHFLGFREVLVMGGSLSWDLQRMMDQLV